MIAGWFYLSLSIQVMKKIIVIVTVLFAAIITMAYLYFSRLNTERKNSDSGLHAAVVNSAVVFSFQNDKSVLDLLKSQPLFPEIIGQENYAELSSLKANLLSIPAVKSLIDQQSIYISLVAADNKKIDLLYTTQISPEATAEQLMPALKSAKILIEQQQLLTKLTLADSSVYYLGVKNKVLLISSSSKPVLDVMGANFEKTNEFVDYIKSNSRLTKTSLAELYIDFASLPLLLKSTMPGKLTGELSVLKKQNSFAMFVYNYSKDKILLTGTSKTNDKDNYFQLFTDLAPQKITINNILPDNTANYSIFTISDYSRWKTLLSKWFVTQKTDQAVVKTIEQNNNRYHLDLDQVFPKYFKGQMMTFQLSTTEKLGAINLSNGDKTDQLLLELSTDYTEEIRIFRVENLLYAYFGEPFRKFKRPYYTIIDNYMVFANHASTVQSFLNSYKNNRLLINEDDYSYTINLLPNSASISFFIALNHSKNIFRKNIYLPYYSHIISIDGLKDYSSLTYQLNGDNGKFQANVLLSKPQKMTLDSLSTNIDSLIDKP